MFKIGSFVIISRQIIKNLTTQYIQIDHKISRSVLESKGERVKL